VSYKTVINAREPKETKKTIYKLGEKQALTAIIETRFKKRERRRSLQGEDPVLILYVGTTH
jgi:hypothetical protein